MKRLNATDVIVAIVLFLAVLFIVTLEFQCNPANAQDKPSVSLRDFSGGLNTNTNPFLLKENEFLQLHNFDITDEFGSISLRRGFKAVTDSFPRPTGADSINITLYVINRVPGPLPPLWPLGEEFLVCSLQSVDYALNVGGLWDNISITKKGSSPDTTTVIANFNPTFTDEGSAKFTGITVYDSSKFDVGDSLYAAQDTALANDTGKVTGLYSYLDRSGRKFLAVITPGFAADGKWSALMLSQQGEYQPSVRLWPYIYKDETPIWETWKNHMFVALPRQRPLVFDGQRTVPLIPRAPGQLEIFPLATSGNIDGIVRYTLLEKMPNDTVIYVGDTVLSVGPDSGTASRIGYVSHEIEFDNENALLFGFPRSAPDSFQVGREDSALFYLCRTRGRPFSGEQPFDSFFVIDSFKIGDLSVLDTLTFIDTVPDDILGKIEEFPFIGAPRGIIPMDTAYVDSITKRNDSAFFIDSSFYAPGGPTYIRRDTSHNDGDSIWNNASKDPNDSVVVGVVYFVTLLDTLNGAISDSSPNLWVPLAKPFQGATSDSTKAIVIGVPPLTAHDSGLVRVVWRTRVILSEDEELTYLVNDTVFVVLLNTIPTRTRVVTRDELERLRREGQVVFSLRIARDFITPRIARRGVPRAAYVLTNPAEDSVVDTLKWAELISAPNRRITSTVNSSIWSPLDNRVSILNGFYAFKDRLFGWVGSRLFMSALDTAFIFRPFQDVAFNLDDGDEITQVVALGPNLLIFKNRSIIELYEPGIDKLVSKGSQNTGIGCIAPHSLVEDNGAIIFLSELGVVSLKASQFQPFGIKTGIISHKINDLILGRSGTKRSAADLKKAVGALVDDKYLLSFPVHTDPSDDTTFVYHIPLDAWSTYDFSFHQATKYDTFTVEGLVQSNRLLFARNDDERIFEFGGSNFFLDSGAADAVIPGIFETRPLFADNDYWRIHNVVLHRSSGQALSGDSTRFVVLDENGNGVDTILIELKTNIRAQQQASATHDFIWSTLKFQTATLGSFWRDSLTIHGLDIWGRRLARQIIQ